MLLPWIAVAVPGLVAVVGYVAIAAEPAEKPAGGAISSAGGQQRQTEADDNDGLGEAKDRWSVERLQLRLSIEDQTTTIKRGWDGYAAFEDNCQPQEFRLEFRNAGPDSVKLDTYLLTRCHLSFEVVGPETGSVRTKLHVIPWSLARPMAQSLESGPRPRQDAAHFQALYARYKALIADAIRSSDKAQALKITEQFNESIGGKLIYAGVVRSGSPPLISRFFRREVFPLPAISYDAADSGKVKVNRFHDYFLMATANPSDGVSVRLVVAADVFAPESESPPQDAGVWSQPLGGLRGRLIASKPVIGSSEQFRVDLRNRRTDPEGRYWCSRSLVRHELEVDGQWYNYYTTVDKKPASFGVAVPSGKEVKDALTFPLSSDWARQIEYDRQDRALHLRPGRHTVRVAVNLDPPVKEAKRPDGLMEHVRFVSNPVEIEILAPRSREVAETDVKRGTVEGVTCRLRVDKAVWRVGEPLKFEAEIRNTGRKAWTRPSDRSTRCQVEVNGRRYHWVGQWIGQVEQGFPRVRLGQQPAKLPIEVDWAWRDDANQWLKCLPGKYTVRVSIPIQPADDAGAESTRVISDPVQIDIVAEDDPAPQAPWGPAAEGVQTRLRVDQRAWKHGETPALLADVRNRGTRELHLWRHQALCELEFDGCWYEWAKADDSFKSSWFPPGREYFDIPFKLLGDWQCKSDNEPLTLTVGKHTIRVAMIARPPSGKARSTLPPIRAVSNAVEINIDDES